jgi:hypothetical protein
MPLGDRLRGRHRNRRTIRSGDEYTLDELQDGRAGLEDVPPDPDPPPGETQGEPWGWTKGPPYPRGYRADGRYDSDRNLLAEAWLASRLGPEWSAMATRDDWAAAWAAVDAGWQP